MPPSIGVNLRVTGHCTQGDRKYMEDVFSVTYQQTSDEEDLEYAFFGVFDGHGGREAAVFARQHLMDFIVKQNNFWSDDDDSVLRAIRDGFIQTHQAMWGELKTWPKTLYGRQSTAGTTASIAFIRRGKIYIGHVGDSAIVLGNADPHGPNNGSPKETVWSAELLTTDHKPESNEEHKRIINSGGYVINKSGVPRVNVDGGPVSLAVSRSLGDLWSYNSEKKVFVVSPEPDTYVYPIDITKNRCLILGTDGVWNMVSPAEAVADVYQTERLNKKYMLYKHQSAINCIGTQPTTTCRWTNPSKHLVEGVMVRWNSSNYIADNTSIITVMLDPLGPPRSQMLKRQKELAVFNTVGGANSIADGQVTRVIPPGASTPRLNLSNEERGVGMDYIRLNSRDNVVTVTNSIISLPQPVTIESFNEERSRQNVIYNRNRRELEGISLSIPSKVISSPSLPRENFKALCKKNVQELCMNPHYRSTI